MHFLAFLNQAQSSPRFHHIACGASLSRRHQDTEKSSRPERRRPRRHQHINSEDTAAARPSPVRQNAGPILAFDGFKRVLSTIKYQELMPDPSY
jgi:hypothetical protein